MSTHGAIQGRPTARHLRGSWRSLATACVLAAGLLGCTGDFTVERRESPVHVWLSVPGLAASGGQLHADVTLGPYGVVRDIVTFPRGVPTVELPTVYVRDGAYVAAVRLREAGVAVVVGTCPDLGTIKPIAPPLKQVARSWSRRLAAAQTIAVVEAGGRSVSLGSILGPEFAAAPALLFGPDQFHPSADGYHQLASVLLPSVLAALDLLPGDDVGLSIRRGDVVLPVAEAAIRAVRSPGVELDGTEVAGAQRGLRGRWVQLSRRGRQPQGEVEPPEAEEAADTDESPDADAPAPDMAKPPEREDSGDSTSMISRG